MLHRHKKLLALFTCLIFVFSIVGSAAASPTTIYGTYNGKTALFSFSDLVSAYGNDVAAFKDVWTNTVKTSMTVDGKNVSWSDFIAAVGNGTATTADGYAALPATVTAPVPATVTPVAASGSVGAEAANPNAPVTTVAISSIAATNGTITPTFAAAAPAGLALADFTVTATLDGAAYTLQSLVFANNAFTFTAVAGTSAEQSLVITVAAAASSTKISGTANATVSIPAVAAVVTTVEVAAVSVEENKTAAPVVTVKDQLGNAMTTGFTLSYASSSSTVASVDATAGVVTAGSYSAGANTATLTVTATPTTGTAVNGTATITVTADTTAPTITSIQNVSGNQLVVTFSEAVNSTNATTFGNYALRNTVTGKQKTLTVNSTLVLSPDKKTLTIALSSADVIDGVNGVGVDGLATLDSVNYRFFANISGATMGTLVSDIATTPNKLATNSYIDFLGVIGADNVPPVVQTASLATATNTLTLSFNEKAYSIDVTKVSITDGTTSITLKAADTADVTTSGAAATTINYTINDPANKTALVSLSGIVTVNLAAGAVKDVAGNAIAATSKAATSVVNPVVQATGTFYDETTSKLTIKFSKSMKITSLTNFGKITFSNTNVAAVAAATATITNGMTLDTTSNSDTLVFSLNTAAKAALQNATARLDANKSVYKISLASDTLTDVAGNDLGVANNNVALTYTRDDTVPAITNASYSTATGKLVVTFSEAVNGGAGVPDISKVAVQDKSNATTFANLGTGACNPIDTVIVPADWNSAKTQVTITLTTAEQTDIKANATTGRFLTLAAAHGITDLNGNALADITTAAAAISINYTDDLGAGVTASNQSVRLVKVVFDKAMNSATVTADKFTVKQANNVNVVKTPSAVLKSRDNKTFWLDLGTTASNQLTATVDYTVSYAAGLTDGTGLAVTAGTTAAYTAAADAAFADPTVALVDDGVVGLTSGDKIRVTFAEPVQIIETTANILTRSNNSEFGTGATVAKGNYDTEVELTVGSSPTFVLGGGGDSFGLNAGDIKDIQANSLGGAFAATVAYPTSATAPLQTGNITVQDVDSSGALSVGDTVTIPFDKALLTGQTLANIAINNKDGATTFTSAVSGSNVVLTLTAVGPTDAMAWQANRTISVTANGSKIKSLWGVEATANVATKAATVDITVAPTITSASYNKNTHLLKVVFSEAVNLTNIAGALSDIFSVTTEYTVPTISSSTVGTGFWLDAADTTNKTVVFLLDGNEAIDPGIVYLNAKAGGATDVAIKDFEGNKPVRADATGVLIAVSGTLSDTTAPTYAIAGASLNGAGDTVTVTFSEPMDKATLTTAKMQASTITWLDTSNDAGNTGEANVALSNAAGSWNAAGTVYTITMNEATDSAYIPNNKFLGLTLPNTVRDLAGNALAGGTEVYTAAAITAEALAPTFTAAMTSQAAATKVMLSGNKQFTVSMKGAFAASNAGALGNSVCAAVYATDLGSGVGFVPTATYDAGTNTLTITINSNAEAATAAVQTVENVLAAVDATTQFSAALSGGGAGATLLVAGDAVGAEAFTGGNSVVTLTFNENALGFNGTNGGAEIVLYDAADTAATTTMTVAPISGTSIVATVNASNKLLTGGKVSLRDATIHDVVGNNCATTHVTIQ